MDIKFRAYSKSENFIFKVRHIHWNGGKVSSVQEELTSHYYMVDDIELMRYIERRDKNNKEIYEGDICRFDGHNYLAKVVYCPEIAAFGFDSCNKETINNPKALMYWDDCEVIGNIHKNPELLK